MSRANVHFELVGDGVGDPILVLPGGGVRDPSYLGDVRAWRTSRPLAVVHPRGTPATGGLPAPWWNQREDLESVREVLGLDEIDVLAHSAGTRVALAYAASGAPVRHLALIGPPAVWLTGTDDDIADLVKSRLDEPEIVTALAAPPMDLSDELRFRDWQHLTAPLGYAAWNDSTMEHAQTGSTDLAALRAFFATPPPASVIEAIRALPVPIHIIGGAVDLLSGHAPVRELAAMFKRGSVELIDGSDHYPWVDQPTAFADALQRWEP
ncbi:alpha/beta hydrolase [Tsukamurella tyrosinosolvens]|uniref:alpha/beta fold hydrolase n=1 Tax=Tsukamurella tyrosinosolvens TaxID=57704 RepID=UPI000837E47F|nr:alpha/beta hydrolase [Tsukamurella tyrosinosolvens]MCA4993559.1 alpha/beta hydrolase [Tsukamurella tyrosinosolvens]